MSALLFFTEICVFHLKTHLSLTKQSIKPTMVYSGPMQRLKLVTLMLLQGVPHLPASSAYSAAVCSEYSNYPFSRDTPPNLADTVD